MPDDAVNSVIDNLTAQHAASGKVIDGNKAAAAVLARYPHCSLTRDEILSRITQSSLRNHALIINGAHRSR